MKLQQLRCVIEVVRQGLSVSAAAEKLYTSQPAVSKQLRALEGELGVALFVRRGKQFVGLTGPGEEIVALAEDVVRRAEGIRRIARDHASPDQGDITIATTHTLACTCLPRVLARFRASYPQVRAQLLTAPRAQLPALARDEAVDLTVTPLPPARHESLALLPWGVWGWALLVPAGHPFGLARELALDALAAQPLVAHPELVQPGGALARLAAAAELHLDVRATAPDSSVLKALVRAGLGLGLTQADAYQPETDTDLAAVPVPALPGGTIHFGLRRDVRPRTYVQDFITTCAPHLTRGLIAEALALRDAAAIAALVATSAPAAMI